MTRRPRIPGTPGRPPHVLYVLPSIDDDLDPETKNAIAIRNAASTTGVCPCCGTHGERTGPDERGFHHLTFTHEAWCDALTDPEAA